MFLPETAVFCITLLVYGAILLLLIYYVSCRLFAKTAGKEKKSKFVIVDT